MIRQLLSGLVHICHCRATWIVAARSCRPGRRAGAEAIVPSGAVRVTPRMRTASSCTAHTTQPRLWTLRPSLLPGLVCRALPGWGRVERTRDGSPRLAPSSPPSSWAMTEAVALGAGGARTRVDRTQRLTFQGLGGEAGCKLKVC